MVERFAKAHGKTARDVMTKDAASVGEERQREEIAQLMERHKIRRVPVVKDGKLVGLVSRADLLRAVLRARSRRRGHRRRGRPRHPARRHRRDARAALDRHLLGLPGCRPTAS